MYKSNKPKYPVRKFNPRMAQLLRVVSAELGERTEAVVDYAFQMARKEPNFPQWILEWKQHEKWSEMDMKGIDYTFTTDVGDIGVQIKSSKRSADDFRWYHREDSQKILVVVIDVTQQPLQIYDKVRNGLFLHRREILRSRAQTTTE